MTNGCICCTLSEDLANQLRQIASSGSFDYIIIEASGICEPLPIAYTIQAFTQGGGEGEAEGMASMQLDNIIAVVDCARLLDEFHSGRDLIDDDEDDIAQLLVEQIEFCSTLILNKIDQVSAEELGEIKAIVRSLQTRARIIEAVRGQVGLKDLLDTDRFDFEDVYASSGWATALSGGKADEHDEGHDSEQHGGYDHDDRGHSDHEHGHDDHEHEDHERGHDHHEHGHGDRGHDHHEHGHHHHHHGESECDDPGCGCHHHHEDGHDHVASFGISTFVYERRKPFAEDVLDDMCDNWLSGVIRCKGMAWLSEDPDHCYVFEQAGHRFYLTENGPWLAVEDEEFRNQVIAEDPTLFEDWDDEIGDRRIKLVFICKGLEREDIESWLDSYLAE